MATKALLYSADKLSFEKTKESRCKALVRQLLAIEIGKRVYQYVVTHAHPGSKLFVKYVPFGLEPLIDARIGVKDTTPQLPGQTRYRAFKREF